ncbi:MAG: Protein MraZ [Candidatus Roizmanbacteria bacterium GW2011_GWA2_32_13]|uniref:Transcriptional regulator MraZ n=1 Tax=Candidatus Roizmanbacteria bacterium GW2011_GWA2_32_13 TaxID=1618475 RepID=A0A0F9ZEG5_9BACT|nr:MAG: Protein MraZ [Candidatus Roizmanbacteria bacterium GW2011_GWA2_32_13]
MDNFIGQFSHSIDEKGRMAVPAKFKPSLKQGVVVTRGFDNCLIVYTIPQWQKEAEKVSALPMSKKNNRAIARLKLAGAMEVKLDSQGRILLPDYLRKYAYLEKKVTVTGLYNHIEIWDEKIWDKYKSNAEKESDKIAEQLDNI